MSVIPFDESTVDCADAVFGVCIDLNRRYSHDLVKEYIQWEATAAYPPGVERDDKVRAFFHLRLPSPSIPIFAKTMTGELIPLVYRADCDKRHLLKQLETIDAAQFPIGSTDLIRLAESSMPVEEGEIVGLFQHGIQTVAYPKQWDVSDVTLYHGSTIEYCFTIKFSQFTFRGVYGEDVDFDDDVYDEHLTGDIDIKIDLIHYLERGMIGSSRCFGNGEYTIYSLDQLHDLEIRYITKEGRYVLKEQARQDLIAMFQVVRRDNRGF